MQRQLTDREAIIDLVSELGLWLDENRFDDARSVLADEVTVDTPGGRSQGIDAVGEQARRNHEAHDTHHVITNVLVDVEGDRATVRANLTATFAALADKSSFVVGERYRFEAVRLPAGWRLSRIRVIPVWRAALNLH
jgi:3-phenylpropionate/cinnamic acid dioxygenase small subunit